MTAALVGFAVWTALAALICGGICYLAAHYDNARHIDFTDSPGTPYEPVDDEADPPPAVVVGLHWYRAQREQADERAARAALRPRTGNVSPSPTREPAA